MNDSVIDIQAVQDEIKFEYGEDDIMVSYENVFPSEDFENAFYYEGDELGAVWSKHKTTFRLWAPTAAEVLLNFYAAGTGANRIESLPMTRDVSGTWYIEKEGNLHGTYYTYTVVTEGIEREAVDPYTKAVGVNGYRGMVVDLDSTDPNGFTDDIKPAFVNATDAVIYELHIRDFSIDESSGMKNKGKYLAFTETGTTSAAGEKTGVDYLVDLGITHVHLLPSFDYNSVDEAKLNTAQFNWGYDPENYNVPEGSYSTDPYHGEVRINEYKQMVQALHNNGIRVVMDVVYNHTAESSDSNFNKIVPNYYYRMKADGTFSNASGCGNETASDRAMMRKFIVDSVVYWATEYHIDGFRFDLMGIHDRKTMNAVREALDRIDPSIIIYGEGWTAGASTLAESERASKENMSLLDTGIAAFNDDMRDGLKGSVFTNTKPGFVNGLRGMEESIKFGVTAATRHNQIDYSKVVYSRKAWAAEPLQTVNYASAHDNLSLWDKISVSCAANSEEDRMKMNLLSAAIVLTSQGIPFFQAGEEFLRSKPLNEAGTVFDENSYKSPDSVNSLKWGRRSTYSQVYNYYKGLIAFRKAHAAIRMTSTADIQANLNFLEDLEENVVGYIINNSPNGETAKAICIIYNANKTETTVTIPEGNWKVYVKGNRAGSNILETITGKKVTVEAMSALVLLREDTKAAVSTCESSAALKTPGNKAIRYTAIGMAVTVAVVCAAIFTSHRRK